jgi:iron complex outermembrane receptor protein
VITPQLTVAPNDLFVYTGENSDAANDNGDATPISVNSVNKNIGFYLTDTADVTPELAITASGRYNISHVDLYDQLGTNLSGHNRFAHFNPSVGLTYKITPDMTFYGGVSVNTRTPTASEIECSDPATPCLLPTNLAGDPPNLRQVISHTYEVGVRGKLEGALSYNLSAFRTLLQNDIYGIATSVSQGFFQNIGDTEREGFEAGLNYRSANWSAFANYSFVQATFRSALTVPSPSNPFQDDNGDIQVEPGNRLPGIPKHRLKLGLDFKPIQQLTVGATVNVVSNFYYVGDESNQLAPVPGYTVVNLHSTFRPISHVEVFATINNLLNRKYATWGILSDPTGIGAPGVPADGVMNGPDVDNRFQSPAAPFEIFGGVRVTF